jgi:LytS/YehU family sensor histidine kinase
MILQPLIENCIKHGVNVSSKPVNINMSCEIQDGFLIILISNNFDEDAVHSKGEGIGIKSIKNRLTLLYKQDNLVQINKSDTLFEVKLFIPQQK